MTVDVAIIGGGLAGLSLSIDLRKRGYQVVVVEKGDYPRHKVCGEYISMESQGYLHRVCPQLQDMALPQIRRFQLTTGPYKTFTTPLAMGGFGISRYLLEELLFTDAKHIGVSFLLNTKVLMIEGDAEAGEYTVKTDAQFLKASLVCNATGRKSNLETKDGPSLQGTNYVGVKYHLKTVRDPDLIEIHNFPGGYCGISNIEEGKSCLCYLVNSRYLKAAGNSIGELEKKVLFQNSRLETLFKNAEFLFNEPLTISGVNFRIKKPTNDHSLFLGDSAGSIAPITGNGMSIGLRSASVLANTIDAYFSDKISRYQLMDTYTAFWNKEFSTRIKLSRHFQKLSEYSVLTQMTIGLFNFFPPLAKAVIRQTHGQPF